MGALNWSHNPSPGERIAEVHDAAYMTYYALIPPGMTVDKVADEFAREYDHGDKGLTGQTLSPRTASDPVVDVAVYIYDTYAEGNDTTSASASGDYCWDEIEDDEEEEE